MKIHRNLGPILALGLMVGCHGGGSSAPPPVPGTLKLILGTDSLVGYANVVVGVEKVEWSADGSHFNALGIVQKTFDLVPMQNGQGPTLGVLLPAVSINPVTITKFRITWATANYNTGDAGLLPAAYVRIDAKNSGRLSMPLTTTVSGTVAVTSSNTTQAEIMLSGQQALQARGGLGAQPYSFQPTGAVYDLASAANITGVLTSGTPPLPLGNVEVYAETGSGLTASIVRRSFSDPKTGAFTLDALPTGQLYFVVAQPGASLVPLAGAPAVAYKALASLAVNATSAINYPIATMSFVSPISVASLAYAITPPSAGTECTWAEVRDSLGIGDPLSPNPLTLIVRSLGVASFPTQDTVAFAGIGTNSRAAGPFYQVRILRSVAGATPITKDLSLQSLDANESASSSLILP